MGRLGTVAHSIDLFRPNLISELAGTAGMYLSFFLPLTLQRGQSFHASITGMSWELGRLSSPPDCEFYRSRVFAHLFMCLMFTKHEKILLPFLECSSLCYVIPSVTMFC